MLSAPRNVHLGSGQNLYDFTYAPNLADAHVLAAQNLLSVAPAEPANRASAAGKPFFVTNAEPLPFRTFMNMLWAADDARRGREPAKAKGTTIPRRLAWGLTWVSEKGARIAGRAPALTVKNLGDGTAQRWFDNSAAKEVLGYVPATTLAKGLEEALGGWRAGTTGTMR
jgi:sterol-4alpha-carboxylate 3-dehydrogenase (decarboxylating)